MIAVSSIDAPRRLCERPVYLPHWGLAGAAGATVLSAFAAATSASRSGLPNSACAFRSAISCGSLSLRWRWRHCCGSSRRRAPLPCWRHMSGRRGGLFRGTCPVLRTNAGADTPPTPPTFEGMSRIQYDFGLLISWYSRTRAPSQTRAASSASTNRTATAAATAGERILLLCGIGIKRVVIREFPGDHHLDRGNAQYVVQVLLRRLGDHGIAGCDVVRKRVIAHVELGQ